MTPAAGDLVVHSRAKTRFGRSTGWRALPRAAYLHVRSSATRSCATMATAVVRRPTMRLAASLAGCVGPPEGSGACNNGLHVPAPTSMLNHIRAHRCCMYIRHTTELSVLAWPRNIWARRGEVNSYTRGNRSCRWWTMRTGGSMRHDCSLRIESKIAVPWRASTLPPETLPIGS